jgi:hypothetical protein
MGQAQLVFEEGQGRQLPRRTTGGPMVRLGTKFPSKTSTWIHSAPAAATRLTSRARSAKSADRIEGEIMACGPPALT